MVQSQHEENGETGGEQNRAEMLSLLGDQTCRQILRATSEAPQSAGELEARCDVSLSSIYRKLDILETASLVDEQVRITDQDKHTRAFVSCVDSIEVTFSPEGTFDVSVDRTSPGQSHQAGGHRSGHSDENAKTSATVTGPQSSLSAQTD